MNFRSQTVFLWLLAYALAWVALPVWLTTSFALDVNEGIAWGRQWQWGYYKHPPLPSWLLYGFFSLFGKAGPYLLSVGSVALALYWIYRLGRRALPRNQALMGSVLTLLIYYYTLPLLEYNHNIAQLPAWSGMALAFMRALETRRARDWVILGVAAGVSMLMKYSSGLMIASMAIFLVLPAQRCLWATRLPWLALAVFMLVLSPHGVWLVENDWLPFRYAASRAHSPGRITAALQFVAAQLAAHGLLLLVLAVSGAGRRLSKPRLSQESVMWIFWAGWTPFVLTLILSLGANMGLHDMWGAPMWNLSGLMFMLCLPESAFRQLEARLFNAWKIALTMLAALMGAYLVYQVSYRRTPTRIAWPQQAIAERAQNQWSQLSRCPLDSIAGSHWLAGLVVADAPDKPSILLEGEPRLSPWMNEARVREHGALLVWQENSPSDAPFLQRLSESMIAGEGLWSFDWPSKRVGAPLVVHWKAYVPDACRAPLTRASSLQ